MHQQLMAHHIQCRGFSFIRFISDFLASSDAITIAIGPVVTKVLRDSDISPVTLRLAWAGSTVLVALY